jgi:molybdopterin/thiamine biosynthesis adenylyltransferase
MARAVKVGSADEDRYDRSKRLGWFDLDKVARARILLVGAGALGNEVAKDLALSGFRKITIVDMDHVVGSNLNRCLFFSQADADERRAKAEAVAEGLLRLNGDCRPEAIVGKVQEVPPERFKRFDIVLGCLDNIDARIYVNALAYRAGKVHIDGGMEGMVGKVMISKPPDGACLQCGMNRTHGKIVSLRFSCTGKDVVFHEPRIAAEITTTSIVSAVMVRETLKVASNRPDLLLKNAFYYDGQRNISEELEIDLDPECQVHSSYPRRSGMRSRSKVGKKSFATSRRP